MTLFKSEPYRLKYISMSGPLRSNRARVESSRHSSLSYRDQCDLEYSCYHDEFYDRVFDYQRVPVSMTTALRDVTPPKQARSSSSSVLRRRRDQQHIRHRSRISSTSSRPAQLRMAELHSIKRELRVIKVQIDELLASLEQMDTQKHELSEGSVLCSPHGSSLCSMEGSYGSPSPPSLCGTDKERFSLEPGEASDGEIQQINSHNSDLECM